MKNKHVFLVACLALLLTSPLLAHNGRRMDIAVVNNQIFGQGYNSSLTTDGSPFVRPYQNVIHGHFDGNGTATLPGLDVLFENSYAHPTAGILPYGYQNDASQLVGYDLTMTLMGAGKWASPTSGNIVLDPLDNASEWIGIGYNQPGGYGNIAGFDTRDIGVSNLEFNLINADNWNSAAIAIGDLDFDFQFFNSSGAVPPSDSIYYLQWEIASANPMIQSSEPIAFVLAPEGMPFHGPALAMEGYFSVSAVPEPGTAGLLASVSMLLLGIRRRR